MHSNCGTKDNIPEALRYFFAAHPKCALAFSGGSDSAYLLYAAKRCGAEVGAYYVRSQFQAEFEYADALRMAGELGCRMRTIEIDVLSDKSVAENPEDRCYHCKRRIFQAIIGAAKADGYETVIDGTNASDNFEDRPGMRALQELEVLSPLRECGVSKEALRMYSRSAGLFTWNKPAYACLATRIPCGMRISAQLLEKVQRSEKTLKKMGFTDFRVRICPDNSAKIQIHKSQLDLFSDHREDVLGALEDDFSDILLDLRLRGETINE